LRTPATFILYFHSIKHPIRSFGVLAEIKRRTGFIEKGLNLIPSLFANAAAPTVIPEPA
jgi:hypothetical protein